MSKKQLISVDVATKICSNAKPIIEWQHNAEEETSSGEDEVWWITGQSVNFRIIIQVVYSDKQKTTVTAGSIVHMVQGESAKKSNLII